MSTVETFHDAIPYVMVKQICRVCREKSFRPVDTLTLPLIFTCCAECDLKYYKARVKKAHEIMLESFKLKKPEEKV